jgi:hypothetical protein
MNPHGLEQDLLTRLPGLAARWRARELAPAAFAALYFLLWQMALHGRWFAARRRRDDARPDLTAWLAGMDARDGEALRARLLDWLGRYQFRGVIANVPTALGQWLRGDWPLVLREDIPDPRAVLRMQARGTRAVTVLTAWPRLRAPVLDKPDAFAFFLHDLEHAYKFFHSPALHAGQRAFFTALEDALDRGVFAPYFGDAGFVARFHYLMSDMNTHPEHSRGYLRAILIEFHLRREGKAPAAPLSASSERAVDGVMHAVGRMHLAVCA